MYLVVYFCGSNVEKDHLTSFSHFFRPYLQESCLNFNLIQFVDMHIKKIKFKKISNKREINTLQSHLTSEYDLDKYNKLMINFHC